MNDHANPAPGPGMAHLHPGRSAPSFTGLAAILLLVVGGLFSVLASVGVWTNRAVLEESVPILLAERVDDINVLIFQDLRIQSLITAMP